MCAPCKVIINSMYQTSSVLADEARRVSLGLYEEPDPTSSSDEELYALACAEAEAIRAVHNQAISIALNRLSESTTRAVDPRSKESAEKWAKLLESLRIG